MLLPSESHDPLYAFDREYAEEWNDLKSISLQHENILISCRSQYEMLRRSLYIFFSFCHVYETSSCRISCTFFRCHINKVKLSFTLKQKSALLPTNFANSAEKTDFTLLPHNSPKCALLIFPLQEPYQHKMDQSRIFLQLTPKESRADF